MPIAKTNNLRENLSNSLESFLFKNIQKYPKEELLKVDLHCHDYNSNSPDELLGRILNLPETWTKTQTLISNLDANNVSAYTITNHNNTRSCYELIEKGYDVLVGAEFSCIVPEYSTGIHVLAYGFNHEQEKKLLKLRNNIYDYLEFACNQNIPTVWAHPLYHYKTKKKLPTIDFFKKMSVIFERFEVLNGQRDNWQNLLVKEWIDHLNPENLNLFAKQNKIEIEKFCRNPYKKSMTGGSDSHIGLFAGQTGTFFHVKDISSKMKNEKMSDIVLNSLRNGNFFPYGTNGDSTRLIISLLNYVCQVAIYRKDPGLVRVLLHKGSLKDKILALLISNGFAELQHHKNTMKIIDLFHNSFMGKKPKMYEQWLIPKDYRRVFSDAVKIADLSKNNSESISDYKFLIDSIYDQLNCLLFKRLSFKLKKIEDGVENKSLDINSIIENIELPSEIRSFFGDNKTDTNNNFKNRANNPDVKELLDGLSFPFLSASILLSAHFLGAKVLYNNRKILNEFSKQLGVFEHNKRILWLTESYGENNGISIFLESLRQEIIEKDLPIDIMVCSNKIVNNQNLIAISPTMELINPVLQNQSLRIPDFLEVQNIFEQNEYDTIICSSDGIMGIVALYLKHAFSVEASVYMYNDSLNELENALNIDHENKKRLLRLFRLYYKSFDRIIVLNQQHKDWMIGRKMSISKDKVYLSSKFTSNHIHYAEVSKKHMFGLENNFPIILYAGELAKNKGVFELAVLFKSLKRKVENLKIVFVGNGSDEKELKSLMPDAYFLGWIEHKNINKIYSAADVLIIPSRFESFNLSALEAIKCNLPVIAYNEYCFKSIIDNGKNGYLVNNIREMEEKAYAILCKKTTIKLNKPNPAFCKSKADASIVLQGLLKELGIQDKHQTNKLLCKNKNNNKKEFQLI
jgi:glycosyltransferase involved in cell wall biosynthesis